MAYERRRPNAVHHGTSETFAKSGCSFCCQQPTLQMLSIIMIRSPPPTIHPRSHSSHLKSAFILGANSRTGEKKTARNIPHVDGIDDRANKQPHTRILPPPAPSWTVSVPAWHMSNGNYMHKYAQEIFWYLRLQQQQQLSISGSSQSGGGRWRRAFVPLLCWQIFFLHGSSCSA